MSDKSILFSGPMIRALIAGTKTQTRRLSTPVAAVHAQRYKKGDRLYVREHWRTGGQHDHLAPRDLPQEWAEPIGYIADEAPNTISRTGRFRQGMHMPRWASRLTLTVTDVRVERLQDISEADALEEGVSFEASLPADAHRHYVAIGDGEVISGWDAGDCYGGLWEHINGGGSWAANPWVAAYTFTVERGNIDRLARAA